jgi:hypothetical protein
LKRKLGGPKIEEKGKQQQKDSTYTFIFSVEIISAPKD